LRPTQPFSQWSPREAFPVGMVTRTLLLKAEIALWRREAERLSFPAPTHKFTAVSVASASRNVAKAGSRFCFDAESLSASQTRLADKICHFLLAGVGR
jgi:hypothetical protein